MIADVRGFGLFMGIELAREGQPATDACTRVVEGAKARGILLGRVGRAQHIVKMRPPMPFSRENAEQLAQALTEIFAELPA